MVELRLETIRFGKLLRSITRIMQLEH